MFKDYHLSLTIFDIPFPNKNKNIKELIKKILFFPINNDVSKPLKPAKEPPSLQNTITSKFFPIKGASFVILGMETINET